MDVRKFERKKSLSHSILYDVYKDSFKVLAFTNYTCIFKCQLVSILYSLVMCTLSKYMNVHTCMCQYCSNTGTIFILLVI